MTKTLPTTILEHNTRHLSRLGLDVAAVEIIAIVLVIDSATVVSCRVPLGVRARVGIMDVDGTPLAGLVIIITFEDAIGGDGDLLAVRDVVAFVIKELEVLPVVEPVRVLIACVEATLKYMQCQGSC
jgi:hypothetical protein